MKVKNALKGSSRTQLLCYGYIIAFAIVLAAFEYQVPVDLPEDDGWEKEEPLALAREEVEPLKPRNEKKGKKSEEKKPEDPSLEPKEVKEEKEEKPLDEDEIKLPEGIDDPEDKKDWDVPEYVDPNKPVPKHDLSREALMPGCEGVEVKKEAYACTKERMDQAILEELRFPQWLKDQGIEGRAVASFIVDRKGELKQIRIVKKSHPDFGKAVKSALKELPRMVPAEQNGRPVAMVMQLPVSFKLH